MILYHYVIEGRIGIKVPGQPAFDMQAGDIVLFPHNDYHLMGSDLRLPPVPSHDVVLPPTDSGLFRIRIENGGTRSRAVCGYLGCDQLMSNPVLAALPVTLRLRAQDIGAADWVASTFAYATQELAAGRPGSASLLAKLSELLFLEAVRHHVQALPPGARGWLAGLRDPQVARTLSLFHARLGHHWTMEEVSRIVGLSRSSLAERFTQLVGTAPMRYLANRRMQEAAQTLRTTDKSLAQVAAAVGYESEAAFSRAFKKAFGAAPAGWRRQQRARTDALYAA